MYTELLEYCEQRKIKLVAVSKTRSNDEILKRYNQGQRIFGENRVKELAKKHIDLPTDIEWHMIGHLQKKQVKYISDFVDTIHSVDKIDLLEEINKRALKKDRSIKVLLQLKVAKEPTKSGFNPDYLLELHKDKAFGHLNNINICGVMAMGSFTNDQEKLRDEFALVQKTFQDLKNNFYPLDDRFNEISLGMSGDYKLASEYGSTMFRIGSLIFNSSN